LCQITIVNNNTAEKIFVSKSDNTKNRGNI